MKVIDRYYERQIKERAKLIVEKIDNGVYFIVSDKPGIFISRNYIGTNELLEVLEDHQVMLIRGKGADNCLINFEFQYE